MSTIKLNIGKIPISKGEYQKGTTYQRLNQVTMLGSTYQSKIDDNTSAPAQIGADGVAENINTDKWLCVAVGSVSVARKVMYNNETSGLEAGNVQEAIDGIAKKTSKIKGVISSSNSLDSKKEISDIGLWFVNRTPDPGIVLVCYDFEKHYVQVKLSATRNVSLNETTNKPSIQYRKYIDNAWTEWADIEFNVLKTHILQADDIAIQDIPLAEYVKSIIKPVKTELDEKLSELSSTVTKFVSMSEAAYEALEEKDADTYYMLTEE